MLTRPIEVIGAPASPYTRKLIAILRYRQIHHVVHWRDARAVLEEKGLTPPKVGLLPTVLIPDGDEAFEVAIDSSPIIRALDGRFARRRVRPVDPALALIDSLLEDFGDEWCTKLMFHYRWHFEADASYNEIALPIVLNPQMTNEEHAQFGRIFRERQIDRLRYVGSNELTAPVIEAAYARLLELLDDHIPQQRFLLGARPGGGDFAIAGQFTQLTMVDPTPSAMAHQQAPRVVAWTTLMDDLSGWEIQRPAWTPLESQPQSMTNLLCEVGRVYAPLLIANAHAMANGHSEFETTVDGARWAQQTFPYQGKCLGWLRDEYRALGEEDRQRFDDAIRGTGCEFLFSN